MYIDLYANIQLYPKLGIIHIFDVSVCVKNVILLKCCNTYLLEILNNSKRRVLVKT